MKHHQLIVILFFFCLAGFVQAQQADAPGFTEDHKCASEEMQARLFANSPELRAKHAKYLKELRDQRDLNNPNNQLHRTTASASYRVPVVVHIIHNGNDGNTPLADVQAAIELLNESFANGPNFNPATGVDVGMEFCLAVRDPDGNPTTGVVYTDDPISSTFDKNTDDTYIKGLSRWDPTRYYNIYSVATIQGGVAGYAYFASSHGSTVDGIVVEASYLTPSVNNIKVTTHEFGHAMGLPHTFSGGCTNNDCLTDGDGVCDTPPDDATFSSCPGFVNTCTSDEDDTSTNNPFRSTSLGGLGDQPDLTSDYMDYSSQSCMEVFTQGQKDVMILSLTGLRASLITPQNLSATGCQCDPAFPCTPLARFQGDNIFICPGQTVNFTDLSVGPANSWSWFFQGGNPASSTAQNPSVTYASPGTYEVSLTIINGAGNDTRTETGYITVVSATQPPVVEGFETSMNMPFGWATGNFDGGGTWAVTDTTAHTGVHCVVMDNWAFPGGSKDELSSLILDLSTYTSADLTFDYAYQRKSFTFTYDTLTVLISTDCGDTWTSMWEKSGIDLATVTGGNVASRFVPTMTSEWANAMLDLTPYLGSDAVKIKFENRGGGGQSLYLDNINLSGFVSADDPSAGLSWEMDAIPNPFSNSLEVDYTLKSKTGLVFSLYDIAGRELVREDVGTQAPGAYKYSLPEDLIASMPAGIYLLRGQSGSQSITLKVIKDGQF